MRLALKHYVITAGREIRDGEASVRIRVNRRGRSVRNASRGHLDAGNRCAFLSNCAFDRYASSSYLVVVYGCAALELAVTIRVRLWLSLRVHLKANVIGCLFAAVRAHRAKRQVGVIARGELTVSNKRIAPRIFESLSLGGAVACE